MFELRLRVEAYVVVASRQEALKESPIRVSWSAVLTCMGRRLAGFRLAKRLNAHFNLEVMIVQLLFEQEV